MVAVVLAAGEGRRLRPLTEARPKALCPVGGVPLVDHALARVRAVGLDTTVNVHHRRQQLEEHLAARHPDVHVSIEAERALGTAGALGLLRPWLAGRAALVVNADTWCDADLNAFVAGWDGERPRVLVEGAGGFGPRARIAASIVPADWSDTFEAEPLGLYESCWAAAAAADRLDVDHHDGLFVDCGTPIDYLAANLLAADLAGGSIVDPAAMVTGEVEHSVVGHGAAVAGYVRHSVVWDGNEVSAGERLDRAIRASSRLTVLVR
jgi:NDP-sugar pyrophosphorylase family protein